MKQIIRSKMTLVLFQNISPKKGIETRWWCVYRWSLGQRLGRHRDLWGNHWHERKDWRENGKSTYIYLLEMKFDQRSPGTQRKKFKYNENAFSDEKSWQQWKWTQLSRSFMVFSTIPLSVTNFSNKVSPYRRQQRVL